MIDAKHFAALAERLRTADQQLAEAQAVLDRARKWQEAAARHRANCRAAIQSLAEQAAGTKLWP